MSTTTNTITVKLPAIDTSKASTITGRLPPKSAYLSRSLVTADEAPILAVQTIDTSNALDIDTTDAITVKLPPMQPQPMWLQMGREPDSFFARVAKKGHPVRRVSRWADLPAFQPNWPWNCPCRPVHDPRARLPIPCVFGAIGDGRPKPKTDPSNANDKGGLGIDLEAMVHSLVDDGNPSPKTSSASSPSKSKSKSASADHTTPPTSPERDNDTVIVTKIATLTSTANDAIRRAKMWFYLHCEPQTELLAVAEEARVMEQRRRARDRLMGMSLQRLKGIVNGRMGGPFEQAVLEERLAERRRVEGSVWGVNGRRRFWR
ncbi:MAG: hypothetical protein Q9166_007081 [cf. Caloplaca sp. 2 TL-2023]